LNWTTARPNWVEDILAGRSMSPSFDSLPDKERAAKALTTFKMLRISDVPGRPTFGEVAEQWVFDFVAAVFGAHDPETGRQIAREILLLIAKKNTKALALDTEIATPSGFKRMGELAVGDEVFSASGSPTKVLGKSPIYINRPCYEVEFSTGEKVVCDAEHLWVTDAHLDRAGTPGRKTPSPSAKTTEKISRSLFVKSGDLKIHNHRTAICGPLRLPKSSLPIDPYVLGAWLGDGTSSTAHITAGPEDYAEMASHLSECGISVECQSDRGARRLQLRSLSEPDLFGNVAIEAKASRWNLQKVMRALTLLNNKHIPRAYLRASADDRLELLRGLMDTDGTISKAGQASFTTTAESW
jgi:hypothetical protein